MAEATATTTTAATDDIPPSYSSNENIFEEPPAFEVSAKTNLLFKRLQKAESTLKNVRKENEDIRKELDDKTSNGTAATR